MQMADTFLESMAVHDRLAWERRVVSAMVEIGDDGDMVIIPALPKVRQAQAGRPRCARLRADVAPFVPSGYDGGAVTTVAPPKRVAQHTGPEWMGGVAVGTAQLRVYDAERQEALPEVQRWFNTNWATWSRWEKLAAAKVTDAGSQSGTTHIQEVLRRERKQLTAKINSTVRGDCAWRSVWDPLWTAPLENTPPSAANPVGMWRAFPGKAEDIVDDSEPTHGCLTARRWRRWEVAHMWHCSRCQFHSEAVHGRAPPLDELFMAPLDPHWVDPGGWTLDAGCYVRLQVYMVRTGFLPQWDPDIPFVPKVVNNTSTVYDEFAGMVTYFEKLESDDFDFEILSKGTHVRPKMANGLLAVVRESERLRFEAGGEQYKTRPCCDQTTSGVNPSLKKWRFRMQGKDSAVRLFNGDGRREAEVDSGEDTEEMMATVDLSKCYLTLGLHRLFQPFTWFSDVRRETTWRGKLVLKPTKLWFDCQKLRRRKRLPRWRFWKTCNFGLAPMVAYACALGGELVQAFHSWIVDGKPAGRTSNFVDDNLVVNRGRQRTLRSTFLLQTMQEWLGFKPNEKKTTKPARTCEFVGFTICMLTKQLYMSRERCVRLLTRMRHLQTAGKISVKELQRLFGTCNFFAECQLGAATYMQGLKECFPPGSWRDLRDPGRRREAEKKVVSLTPRAKRHVSWWISKLAKPAEWVGSKIILAIHQKPLVIIKSDASG